MGCDIHVFVECANADGTEFSSVTSVSSWMPRNYQVFGALAGVRVHDVPPLFPPRGLPDDVGEEAFEHHFLFVIDRNEIDYFRGRDYVLLDEFESDIREGNVTVIDRDKKQWGQLSNHGYIRNPDWHTSSWLFLNEIYAAFEHAKLDVKHLQPEYRVLLDLMESVDRHCCPRKSRLVFWFDN